MKDSWNKLSESTRILLSLALVFAVMFLYGSLTMGGEGSSDTSYVQCSDGAARAVDGC